TCCSCVSSCFEAFSRRMPTKKKQKSCAVTCRNRTSRTGANSSSSGMKLEIDALDAEGRGVARNAGKVVFVEGALAGELVEARLLESRSKFDRARATAILRPSAGRRDPACPYFGTCGGCATQHVDARTQVAAK